MKDKRAALYLRVSTTDQTVSNQRVELEAAAAARGWTVVVTYADEGISSAKTRHGRPPLDLMLKDAVRRKFDVVMVWAVDRLGRSLPDLIASMQDLHGAKVNLFIHQRGLDTTTTSGRAMFGMLGVFSEFERAMIQSRVKAGLQRAQAEQAAQGAPLKKWNTSRANILSSINADTGLRVRDDSHLALHALAPDDGDGHRGGEGTWGEKRAWVVPMKFLARLCRSRLDNHSTGGSVYDESARSETLRRDRRRNSARYHSQIGPW